MRNPIDTAALVKTALAPNSYAASAQNGTAISVVGFGDVVFVCTFTHGSGDCAFKLQSDSTSGFSTPVDISGAAATVVNANSGKPQLIRLPLDVMAPYVRVVATPTAATTYVSVVAVLQNPSGNVSKPITQDLTPVSVDVQVSQAHYP